MLNYSKLIQLSFTLTKLCRMKRDRLVDFYFSREKHELMRYLCN